MGDFRPAPTMRPTPLPAPSAASTGIAPGTGTVFALCGESALCVCDDCLLGLDDRDDGLDENEPRIAFAMEDAGHVFVREVFVPIGRSSSCGDIWPDGTLFDLWLNGSILVSIASTSLSVGLSESNDVLEALADFDLSTVPATL